MTYCPWQCPVSPRCFSSILWCSFLQSQMSLRPWVFPARPWRCLSIPDVVLPIQYCPSSLDDASSVPDIVPLVPDVVPTVPGAVLIDQVIPSSWCCPSNYGRCPSVPYVVPSVQSLILPSPWWCHYSPWWCSPVLVMLLSPWWCTLFLESLVFRDKNCNCQEC